MCKIKIKYICLFILLVVLLINRVAFSQNEVDTVKSLTGIEIKTSVDRAEIYIGDLITYKVTILYDSIYELVPPPLGANLGAFDVKDFQSDIITRLPDGRIQSENIFILSTFTTGDYIIPPIPAIFNLPDGTRKVLLSEGVPIKVQSLLFNVDDSVDIKPLKAQYEFKRAMMPYYIWGGIIGLFLILMVYYIWYRISRKKQQTEIVDLRPAWEIAFEKLALLKQKGYVEDGKLKEYYVELTEIIRSYHEKMYNLNVLDMTTEEFLSVFQELNLPDGLYDDTNSFLNHADLVKFAKYIPTLEKAYDDFDSAHDMIEKVRIRHEQAQLNIVTGKALKVTTPGTDTPEKTEKIMP